jgi:hypothetical protein
MEVDLLSVALTKAITDAVPDEMRKEIFTKALYEHLFQRSRDNGPTPLQEAFRRALNECAAKMAQELFANPECQGKVKVALDEAFDEWLNDPSRRQKLLEKFSSGLRY